MSRNQTKEQLSIKRDSYIKKLEDLRNENPGWSILEQMEVSKKISGNVLKRLYDSYGDRFIDALKAVLEVRVKRYIFKPSNFTLWIVVGRHGDYVIFSDIYCSCFDFFMSAVLRKENHTCYHILAKKIAEALGIYETFILPDTKYKKLIEEWKTIALSEK